jgi:hypothetical protein
VTYDLTHTYVPPAALGAFGVLSGSAVAIAVTLVWFAHIGMDRALGLGLQYPDGSGCSHLRAPRWGRSETGSGGGAWSG